MHATKKLTKAQNEAIVAAYEGGQRIADIARDVGVTEWTINHRLNRAGTKRRPQSMTPAEIEEAAVLRRGGLSMRQTARRLGFADATVKMELLRRTSDQPT